MKKYILSVMLTLICLFLSSQPIDSLVIKINDRLSKYTENNNLLDLYSIGFTLPRGVYIKNNKMSERDYSHVRKQRTKLYFNWFLKITDAGLDLNYEPSQYNHITAFMLSLAEDQDTEEWKKNKIESIAQENMYRMHVRYIKIMERFQCYYKFAFIEHEKDITTLEELLNAYALEKQLSENIKQKIFVEFKRELEKNTCGF